MESEKGNDVNTSRFAGAFSTVVFNPGNMLDIKDSIRRDIKIPKEVTVEAKNGTEHGKTTSLFGKKHLSRSILDTEIAYDEYEEDEDIVQWQLPKIKELPKLASLLREWSVTQVSVAAHILHKNFIKRKNNYIVRFSLNL